MVRCYAQILRNPRAKVNNSLPPTYSRYCSEGVMRIEILILLCTLTCCFAQKSRNFLSPNIIIMLMDDVSSIFLLCRCDLNETAFANRGLCEQIFECPNAQFLLLDLKFPIPVSLLFRWVGEI